MIAIRAMELVKDGVTKSLNQDQVFIDDALCGYLSHVTKTFLPLADFDDRLTPKVVSALEKLKGHPVSAIEAPVSVETLTTDDDEEDE